MPVMLTSNASFKGLQDALKQAQASLDQVYQIASVLEARSNGKEQPMNAPAEVTAPATGPTTTPTPTAESFEQSIAEMRRIAGFK